MSVSSVKQEQDDAEILELAAKMVEENKAKMAKTIETTRQLGGNLLNFLMNSKENEGSVNPNPKETALPDEVSKKGQFGWTNLGKEHIPYIFRGDDKYCAVRMVEIKVLQKYLQYLRTDIFSCISIHSYYITEAEARLLNEINFTHCDSMFGHDPFLGKDVIVPLEDAGEFFKFLEVCYMKLVSRNTTPSDRCGFVRINKESVVPYTMFDGNRYVPLFYFEGETDNLKTKSMKLLGWDLAYLKFCCKVQGIRNELFSHDSCSVISLADIKNYFPPGTEFEDYWPTKTIGTSLLINGKTRSKLGQWTKSPTTPQIFNSATPLQKIVPPGITVQSSIQVNQNSFGAARGPYAGTQVQNPARCPYPSTSRQTRPVFNSLPAPTVLNQSPRNAVAMQAATNMAVNARKLIPVPNFTHQVSSHAPYKIQKASIEGQMVPCVNMKPYTYTDLFITFNDMVLFFFKNVSHQACYQVTQVLGISLYKANTNQARCLLNGGRIQNITDPIPLVQVRDLMTYMPQLKYMLGGQISLEVRATNS